jgi:hypothetical protein
MAVHILGIRHHGVGSAKNLHARLAELNPDIVLVEGPPEITEVLATIGDKELVPPVALMVYTPEKPKESVFYPFVDYSPEWVAVRYAIKKQIPVRAIDLPAAIGFDRRREETANDEETATPSVHQKDPLSYLAEITGHQSGEEWWDYHFEQPNKNAAEHFEAVMHVMSSLRGEYPDTDSVNTEREAYMRTLIRQAQNELYSNIVVICGAWHGPELVDLDKTIKGDAQILKALPKTKIKPVSTWIPWTNSRLSMFSGYGAGIYSPGWYEHLWASHKHSDIAWLSNAANILRHKGFDISSAHVMESYYLARSLAELRNKYFVSLNEMNEACLSVMCTGDAILLDYIHHDLTVGNKLGKVPDTIPKVPLQEDFELQIKSLRLKLTAETKPQVLDLRNELDLNRSIFFHRLELLGIPWAKRTQSRTKGTFKEAWNTVWSPDMMIELIDKAFLGNTIETAAQTVVLGQCEKSKSISELSVLVQGCIPSELFDTVDSLLDRIIELSSISADITDLMQALPNLIEISRYGNVRKSDATILHTIVQQLLTKVFIGLGNACYELDDDNSFKMFETINRLNHSVKLYDDENQTQQWHIALHKLIDKDGVHAILLGCTCRLLMDAQQINDEEAERRMSFALSVTNEPQRVAHWIEGFLKGNGTILLYDHRLWNLLYAWVSLLPSSTFIELLPLLRRTFSKFEQGVRKQIGTKAQQGQVTTIAKQSDKTLNIDHERAKAILPVIMQLSGIGSKAQL